MADTPKFQTLSPVQLSIAVGYLMSQLPEGALAELDAMLDGDDVQVAEDAAGKSPEKRSWHSMNSHTRHAVRQSRRQAARQQTANDAETLKRFPHMNRIR
jgi:hypothetical protein